MRIAAPMRKRAVGQPGLRRARRTRPTGKQHYQPLSEGVQRGCLHLSWWVLPVDLRDNHQLRWIQVDEFGALERGQLAAPDVGAQDVLGDADRARNTLDRPAPGVADPQAELAGPRPNRCLAATERGCDRDRWL